MKDKIDPYTTPFTPWVCDRCGYIQKLMKKYSYNEYDPEDRDDFCLSLGGKEALCGECNKNNLIKE